MSDVTEDADVLAELREDERKMWVCAPMLPDPGPDVLRDTLRRLALSRRDRDRLAAELAEARAENERLIHHIAEGEEMDAINTASPRHPHEPMIPPSIDTDGHCVVCWIICERDAAQAALAQAQRERDEAWQHVSRQCAAELFDLQVKFGDDLDVLYDETSELVQRWYTRGPQPAERGEGE